ncbi:hypothetical protein BT67DRAFT_177440 [Trichocladium antarcticum]|uniref:Uncharacterized protein n=1 Tax=Trichocladium antarcticum TaxID=1450529 RepID=A0AAN6UR77_9PEZI|nr:hypothetical protein BT67DRAFT_177440 [Trichocladium antarcticum]
MQDIHTSTAPATGRVHCAELVMGNTAEDHAPFFSFSLGIRPTGVAPPNYQPQETRVAKPRSRTGLAGEEARRCGAETAGGVVWGEADRCRALCTSASLRQGRQRRQREGAAVASVRELLVTVRILGGQQWALCFVDLSYPAEPALSVT